MTTYIKKLNESHIGMRVSCIINNVTIEDAKVAVDVEGDYFIVQNVIEGYGMVGDRMGYLHSWSASYTKFKNEEITNLRPLLKEGVIKRELLEEGDILTHPSHLDRKVEGVVGNILFFTKVRSSASVARDLISNMISSGWEFKKIVVPPEQKEAEEMTMEQVCKALGKDIKIKK